jgi:hypothetical protein
MAVTAGHPERNGIDQVNVPRHQFAEGCFGAISRVLAQQLAVVCHRLSNYQNPPKTKSDKDNLAGGEPEGTAKVKAGQSQGHAY